MRANQLAQLQEDVKTLQRQATQEVELLIHRRITCEQEIENNQGRLATQVSSLTSAGNVLSGSVARAEVAASQASTAMQIRQAALQQQLSAVESLESQVLREDARLDGVQNNLEQREREVEARRRQHAVRQQELKRRTDQVQESTRLAEQEQERLHLIENVEIPARERDLQELESTLAEFKKRGIEQSLEEVKTKLSVEGSRLTQLKQAEESLRQLHRELAQKVAEVQDAISREKKLRMLVVDQESALSAAAKRLPDNPASTQNGEAAKSKTSLLKRIFWGFGK
jgi:chromosome segregation ATPase